MAPANDDTKVTAESHAPTTPPLSEALNSFADTKPQAEDGEAPAPAVDDGGLDLTLQKKKKKKKKVEIEGADDGADAAPAGEDGGLDLSMMKKKKKKKALVGDDEFVAKLKTLEVDGGEEGAAGAAADGGDMLEGTGIWAPDESRSIPYDLLLNRFFYLLSQKNPDHALGGAKSKIPPPQCLREGNKKTIFANIAEICKRMKRSEDHMMSYLKAEMGTTGNIDGSRRLVIKGKFQQKQIENLLRKYIIEYVTCKTCKSGDTELSKGENRLYFITCNSCFSRRSVTTIKTGFSAQVGRRKKQG